jgi:hypothetical protein
MLANATDVKLDTIYIREIVTNNVPKMCLIPILKDIVNFVTKHSVSNVKELIAVQDVLLALYWSMIQSQLLHNHLQLQKYAYLNAHHRLLILQLSFCAVVLLLCLHPQTPLQVVCLLIYF